jgi:hypothetical protein
VCNVNSVRVLGDFIDLQLEHSLARPLDKEWGTRLDSGAHCSLGRGRRSLPQIKGLPLAGDTDKPAHNIQVEIYKGCGHESVEVDLEEPNMELS